MPNFKLTKDNIADFFVNKVAPKLPFQFLEIKERDEVSKWSNNNYLWRLSLKTKRGPIVMYVKQAQEYNRRSVAKGHPERVDPKRICGEYQLVSYLRKIWGKGFVPEIYYFDPRWCITVMSDVSCGAKLLVEELAKNKVYDKLGIIFGKLFGKLHSSTYCSKFECCGSINWHKVMRWFFEQYLTVGIRKFISKNEVGKFLKETRCVHHSWIWGDAVHRNIFVRLKPRRGETKLSMVDFDHAHRYDPAVDCGMLLAHWLWMGLKSRKLKVQSEKFVEDFWKAYHKEFKKKRLKKESENIEKRAKRWAGIYLVSRTDGKSGSYFAKWPNWESKIRKLGLSLFKEEEIH